MEASLLSALGYDYELNQKIVVNFQKDVETWVGAAIEAAREISHAKPPRIRRVCLMLDSHARILTIRHRSEQRIRNNYSTTG